MALKISDIEKRISKFLRLQGKDNTGCYILYDRFSFDELYKLLLESGMNDESALSFIFANCSLSALVFQQRIHNKYYKKIIPGKFNLRNDLMRIWNQIETKS